MCISFAKINKGIYIDSVKIMKEEKNLKAFILFNLKLFCTAKRGTMIMYENIIKDTNVISKWRRHSLYQK